MLVVVIVQLVIVMAMLVRLPGVGRLIVLVIMTLAGGMAVGMAVLMAVLVSMGMGVGMAVDGAAMGMLVGMDVTVLVGVLVLMLVPLCAAMIVRVAAMHDRLSPCRDPITGA